MGASINGGTQNGLFTMENPIKMDDLGGTYFRKPPENSLILFLFSGIFLRNVQFRR